MSETGAPRRAVRRALFLLLCTTLIVMRLLPINASVTWPGPDLMLCLILAWVLRRPNDLPAWLLAPVLLLADLLLMRPPGLCAVLVLIACEFLYRRQSRTRALPFLAEWALVAMIVTALVIGHWVALEMVFVNQTGLAAQLRQVPVTVAAYPLVVLMMHAVLRIRKRPAPEGFGRSVAP